MRFITQYPYATTPGQNADNIRNVVDGLYDGQHDVRFNSIRISTAPVTATLTHGGMYIGIASGFVIRVFTGSV